MASLHLTFANWCHESTIVGSLSWSFIQIVVVHFVQSQHIFLRVCSFLKFQTSSNWETQGHLRMVAETTRSRQSLEVKSSSRGEGRLTFSAIQLYNWCSISQIIHRGGKRTVLMFGGRFYRIIYECERLRMCALLIVCLRVMGGIEGWSVVMRGDISTLA